MIVYTTFKQAFLDALNQTGSYVVMNGYIWKSFPAPTESDLVVLMPKPQIDQLCAQLSKLPMVKGITLSTRFHSAQVQINLDGQVMVNVYLVHQFIYQSLVFMDAEQVIQKRVGNQRGVQMPCIEHLFEYAVLSSLLAARGWTHTQFQYFEEFHALIKEDLIEFFNQKYATTLVNLQGLLVFREANRRQAVQQLKDMPANRFIKTINIRWHHFMGTLRQARII
ncbi:MAG: hypothetical protein AAFP19_18390 [Bacteroidota bacterium]